MSLSLVQDGQLIPVARSVEGFELSIPTGKEEFVAIVEILGKTVRFGGRDGPAEEALVVDLADSVETFENPDPGTIRNLVCASEKQVKCISSICLEPDNIEVGYLDKDSALVRLTLSKIAGAATSNSAEASTSNTSDASNLPKRPGDYNRKTWANCFGTFSPKNDVKCVGGWRKGKPHGQGTHTLADGSVKEGIWEKGCLKDFCFEEF